MTARVTTADDVFAGRVVVHDHTVTVIEPAKEQEGRVFFGATVEVEDDDGNRSRYRLIGTDEIDLKRGWISIESPIFRHACMTLPSGPGRRNCSTALKAFV